MSIILSELGVVSSFSAIVLQLDKSVYRVMEGDSVQACVSRMIGESEHDVDVTVSTLPNSASMSY